MHLFVYGTLLSAFDNPMSRLLQRQGYALCKAKVPGTLYDLGEYPAAIYQAGELSYITGEIIYLKNPSLLSTLDAYEGEEYQRIQIQISVEGNVYNCWMYVYRASTFDVPPILSGDYLSYRRNNSNSAT